MQNSRIALAVLGTAYSVYILARAYTVPITIDEGYSIMTYVSKPVWQILTYQYNELSANNHILNTLCIKWLAALQGMNLNAARLGNIVCGIGYVWAGARLMEALFPDRTLRIAGFVLWLGNIYMAEFFSIGRGYGMSIGLMALSIGWMYRHLQDHRFRTLAYALGIAWLSVAANFTLLNYYLFLTAFSLWLVAAYPGRRVLRFSLIAGFSLVMGIFLYMPFLQMRSVNEFDKFGAKGFYEDTLYTFVRSAFRGEEYFGPDTYPVCTYILAGLFFVLLAAGLWQWQRARFRWSPPLFLAALLPGVLLVNVSMTLLTSATWLPGRTNAFFYPLLIASLAGVLAGVPLAFARRALLILALPVAWHFGNTLNLRDSFEWWFDRNTRKVLDYVANVYQEEKRGQPIRLSCYWLYDPSFDFHIKYDRAGYDRYVVRDIPWMGLPKVEDNWEYYYCGREQMEQLRDLYEVVWVVEANNQYLLRLKNR
jgi:hypothetical protein